MYRTSGVMTWTVGNDLTRPLYVLLSSYLFQNKNTKMDISCTSSFVHKTNILPLYPLLPCLLSRYSVLAILEAAEDVQVASLF